jgi:hypothetical protein
MGENDDSELLHPVRGEMFIEPPAAREVLQLL